MSKLIVWFLERTKLGAASKTLQTAIDGKKQMLVSLAAAIPATVLILTNFSKMGNAYLADLTGSAEFTTASLAWAAFFNSLKGEKTRHEIKELKDMIQPTTQIQGETK